jgi:prepilin-type N-terminal cleavage/methylation domain-containing protein
MKTRKRGFTLVEIMIVILIMSILLSIGVPQMMTARRNAYKRTCQTNLRGIDGAKQQLAMEQRLAQGTPVVMADVLPYLRTQPECPMGGVYDVTTIGELAECDIVEHPHPDL